MRPFNISESSDLWIYSFFVSNIQNSREVSLSDPTYLNHFEFKPSAINAICCPLNWERASPTYTLAYLERSPVLLSVVNSSVRKPSTRSLYMPPDVTDLTSMSPSLETTVEVYPVPVRLSRVLSIAVSLIALNISLFGRALKLKYSAPRFEILLNSLTKSFTADL